MADPRRPSVVDDALGERGLALPDLGRYVDGHRDQGLVELRQMLREPDRLPQVIDGTLDATGADVAHLQAELHRLGHVIVEGHQHARLAPPAAVGADPHDVAVITGYLAAAPVWASTLSVIAELDAAFVVTRCDQFAVWDAAVAEVVMRWSVRGRVRPDEASLAEQARDALVANRRALEVLTASTAPAELVSLWDRAIALAGHGDAVAAGSLRGLIGVGGSRRGPSANDLLVLAAALSATAALRSTVTSRTSELIALGEALDQSANESTPLHACALSLAARAAHAGTLAAAVCDWLEDLDVIGATTPARAGVQQATIRLDRIGSNLLRRLPLTLKGLRSLTGMSP